MKTINLLPWREARQREKNRRFYRLLTLVACLGLLCVFLAYLEIRRSTEYQTRRNTYLESQIAELKAAEVEMRAMQKVQAQVMSHVRIIQSLQSQRPDMVNWMDELVRLIPASVYLTGLGYNETGRVSMTGMGQSNNVVSEFMRLLGESPEFAVPSLDVVKRTTLNGIPVSQFELHLQRRRTTPDAAPATPPTSPNPVSP